MTRNEATKALAIIKAAYPKFCNWKNSQETALAVLEWWAQFKNTSAEIVMMAIQKHISANPAPPNICEIKKKIREIYWEAQAALAFNDINESTRHALERILSEARPYIYNYPIEPGLLDIIEGQSIPLLLEKEE